MKSGLLAATGLAWLAIGQPLFAADLSAPVAKAPAMVPAFSSGWTGFYIGAHAGWGWSKGDEGVTYLPDPVSFGGPPFGVKNSRDGFVGGGQIGYNWQSGMWVFGIEADFSFADIKGSSTTSVLPTFTPPPLAGSFHTSSWDMNWFGTVRGRLGVAAGNTWLLYATGGLAYANIDYSARTFFQAGADYLGSGSATKAGWTVGAGLEWAFAPSWSVKAEYLYFDLGDTTITGTRPFVSPFAVLTTFENTGHIGRVGLNYRFGGPGPVVARY